MGAGRCARHVSIATDAEVRSRRGVESQRPVLREIDVAKTDGHRAGRARAGKYPIGRRKRIRLPLADVISGVAAHLQDAIRSGRLVRRSDGEIECGRRSAAGAGRGKHHLETSLGSGRSRNQAAARFQHQPSRQILSGITRIGLAGFHLVAERLVLRGVDGQLAREMIYRRQRTGRIEKNLTDQRRTRPFRPPRERGVESCNRVTRSVSDFLHRKGTGQCVGTPAVAGDTQACLI